jgi:hypothetical protein
VFIFLGVFVLNSCNYSNDQNQRQNSYLINNQRIEIQNAFDTLQTLFEVQNSFRIMDIYSEQVHSIDEYIPAIADEVFFFYTVGKSEIKYCSKFYVYKENVETIFHMKTKEEIEEFVSTQDKMRNIIRNSIESTRKILDSK